MIRNLTISLFLTLLIESITSYIYGVKKPKDQVLVALVNICTNPVVVFITAIIRTYFNKTYIIALIIMEILIFIIEGKIFEKYITKEKEPYKLSYINNITSFAVGMVFNQAMIV